MPKKRREGSPVGIGTLNESSLHRALKMRYAGTEERTERQIGEYICDGLSASGEFIEVQTGSFRPLQDKIPILTASRPLRIIHPIIVEKTIKLYDSEGALVSSRRSPKKGSPWDLFNALLYAPLLPLNPRLTIELILVDAAERRILDGKGSWRRRGASIQDRELERYRYAIPLSSLEDYYQFIPEDIPEDFSALTLKTLAKIPLPTAQKTLYTLRKLDIVERIGKSKNAYVYRIKKGRPPATRRSLPL